MLLAIYSFLNEKWIYRFFLKNKTRTKFFISSFLAFEVLLDDILGLRLFAIVLNHHTSATNYFTGFSLSVSFTEAYPFPWFLVVINLNQVGLVLSTKCFH